MLVFRWIKEDQGHEQQEQSPFDGPSFKSDVLALADRIGVGESTIRRWVAEEEEKYRQSQVANPTPLTEKCKHCGELITGNETCPSCGHQLASECIDCHREKAHGDIVGMG